VVVAAFGGDDVDEHLADGGATRVVQPHLDSPVTAASEEPTGH
jgi:hypothetical protein